MLNASVYKALNNITINDSEKLGEDLKNAVKDWFITTVNNKDNLKVLVDDIPAATWKLAITKLKSKNDEAVYKDIKS